MIRSVVVFLALTMLFVVPASAGVAVEKPELPKGYATWPLTVTFSCKIDATPIKVSLWIRGEDSGSKLSSSRNQAGRLVASVSINGRARLFVHLLLDDLKDSSLPNGDLYFKTKEGWQKVFITDDGRGKGLERLEEMLKVLFTEAGVVPESSFESTLERLFLKCLTGPPKK